MNKSIENNNNFIIKNIGKNIGLYSILTYSLLSMIHVFGDMNSNDQFIKGAQKELDEFDSKYTSLDPEVRTLCLNSFKALINQETQFIIGKEFVLGTGVPIVREVRSNVMFQRFLDENKEYITSIIKMHQISNFSGFHNYMHTIAYEEHNFLRPPALVAYTKQGDCDDKTYLGILLLHELGFSCGTVFVEKKSQTEMNGHAILLMKIDENNLNQQQFINENHLTTKIIHGKNNEEYLLYESTNKTSNINDAFYSHKEFQKLFTVFDSFLYGSTEGENLKELF